MNPLSRFSWVLRHSFNNEITVCSSKGLGPYLPIVYFAKLFFQISAKNISKESFRWKGFGLASIWYPCTQFFLCCCEQNWTASCVSIARRLHCTFVFTHAKWEWKITGIKQKPVAPTLQSGASYLKARGNGEPNLWSAKQWHVFIVHHWKGNRNIKSAQCKFQLQTLSV